MFGQTENWSLGAGDYIVVQINHRENTITLSPLSSELSLISVVPLFVKKTYSAMLFALQPMDSASSVCQLKNRYNGQIRLFFK